MLLPVNAAMMDACVLATLDKEDTYGYRITQQLSQGLGVSESSLYPVLRRLQKDGCLTTYDVAISGRNRRYYRITPRGRFCWAWRSSAGAWACSAASSPDTCAIGPAC